MRSLALSVLLALGVASLVGCSGAASTDGAVAADDSSTSDASALSVKSLAVGATLTTTASLNLRTGPSTGHSVITVIPRGASVSLKSTTSHSGWLSISYDGNDGYSSGQYLKVATSSGGGTTTDGGTSTGGGTTTTGGTDPIARAEEWVAADMPYCGGTNGGHDSICGGTCERGGSADNSDWNSYRSDCSGLVSYAWGLAAPGLTTAGFAPFNTSASYEVDATTLQAGDALNSYPEQHIILFKAWVDENAGTATVIEEYNCGHNATEHTITIETTAGSSHAYVPDWSPHNFRAIRQR